MNRTCLIAGSLLILGIAGISQAAISYSYSTDATNYQATAAGQPITISISVNEKLTSGSQSLLTAGTNSGLIGAGYYVVKSGGSGATITASNGNANAINAAVPGFGTGGITISNQQVASDGSAAAMLESGNNTNGPTGVATATGRQVLLGTLSLTAGPVGTTTTYTLKPYVNVPSTLGGSGQDGNTVTYQFNDLDVTGTSPAYTGADSAPFATFSVTTTPEPSSLLLCGLGIGGLLIRRRSGNLASCR